LQINPLKQPAIYNQLERDAQQVPPGSNGLLHLPYLCGAMNPYWDINAKGAFVGINSSHTRGHMYRSILEGIAFEQLFAINAVEKYIGTEINDFVAIGGGANSDLWCQIFADVTGKNICVLENPEASALGAAISAAASAGWYRTFKESASKMSRVKMIIKPKMQNQKKYQQLFSLYKKLYHALK
jgi:sugar (pentulose or hexulose) kinase